MGKTQDGKRQFSDSNMLNTVFGVGTTGCVEEKYIIELEWKNNSIPVSEVDMIHCSKTVKSRCVSEN